MSTEPVRPLIASRSPSPHGIIRSLALLVAAALLAACGAPNLVGVQGRLTDSSGVPISGTQSMTIKFFTNANGTGTAVYTQTRTIDVSNGLFTIDIGQGVMQPTSGMDPIIFAQRLYAQVIVNTEVLTPLVPVTGAPYALSLTPGAVVAGNFNNDPNFGILSLSNGSQAAGGSPVLMLGIPNGGAVDTPFLKACRNNSSDRACDDPKFVVNYDGTVNADGAYSSPAADFAEWMLVDGEAEAGDVLMISDARDRAVTRSSEAASTRIVGAVSTQPAFLGGQPSADDGQSRVMVAMVGIVPVKVSAENGPIRRGDLLVSAGTPGHAMRAGAQPAPGTILGKSLGTLTSGTGVVEVVLMAR